MGWADGVLLLLAMLYFLFNIKNVLNFFAWSFFENGILFSTALVLLIAIFVFGFVLAFVAPQYGWIPQRAFILYIVAFVIYRLIFGVRDRESH